MFISLSILQTPSSQDPLLDIPPATHRTWMHTRRDKTSEPSEMISTALVCFSLYYDLEEVTDIPVLHFPNLGN